MPADYNVVDIVFITSALIIIAIASFRGLIKEVFSLINWATAFVASYLLSGIVAKIFAQGSTLNIAVIEIITRVAIFTIVFLIMVFSTSGLAKEITSAFPPALNNFLGVVFGAFKTLLIFGLLYATYLTVNQIISGTKIKISKDLKTPPIIASAKTGSIIKYSGEFLQPVVYGFVSSIYSNYSNSLAEKTQEIAPLLHLMQNNYDLDELQKEIQDGQNLNNLQDLQNLKDAVEQNPDNEEYKTKLQKLQQMLNSINSQNNQPNIQPDKNPAQQPSQKPIEEKGYKKQEILKKDYIIKINNN